MDWRGGTQTWEPVSQIHEDVTEKIMTYPRSKEDSPTLTALMETLRSPTTITKIVGRGRGDAVEDVVVDVVVVVVVDEDAVVDVVSVEDEGRSLSKN